MSETVYRGFSREELDAAYDNTRAVSESSALLKGFDSRSRIVAEKFQATMDIPYGELPRQKYDYFPGKPGMGVFVFIHGGYWQMRHKDTFRFLAKGPLSLGMHVASIGYTLAPEKNLSGIVEEVRLALKTIRDEAKKFQANAENLIVSGWSAGGHLASMMLGTSGVSAALCISGIYDLEPISKCYLNDALKLSKEEILSLSPMRIPCERKPMAIVVGENELPELRKQSLEFSTLRASERIPGAFMLVGGANHFSILLELEKPEGVLCQMLKMFLKESKIH